MEKINDCQMIKTKPSVLFRNPLLIILCLTAAMMFSRPQTSPAQIRAGVGYLKMLHGAREAGMVGTLTGALDYTYSFYANPGATGFLREWQWSATYTNWISDVYNASFLYGAKMPMPWSRQTRFAVGVNYFGIPEFNNANELLRAVSGNHLLVTASLGQPMTFLSDKISLGASIKYFNSTLASYKSDAWMVDVGALARTPRFRLNRLSFGILDYIIGSAGVSFTNVGNPITFIAEKTPLPTTLRGGIAVNLGSHRGIQFNLGADYRKIRDEDGFATVGSEISWRQLVSLRLGYSWEENLLDHFVFGGSIRLDDQLIHKTILGRSNTLRFDLATNEGNNIIDSPYHGTVTHQPIGPERFRLTRPAYGEFVDSDSVRLRWDLTSDPDLYDDVQQWVMVDRDSARLAQLIRSIPTGEAKLFSYLEDFPLLISQPVPEAELLMETTKRGDYFWTVLAYDKDNHVRFGKMNGQVIAKFRVTAPEPKVIAIGFDHSPWITQSDEQGRLIFKITNVGDRIAKNFTLSIQDSVLLTPDASHWQKGKRLLSEQTLPELAVADTIMIEFDWQTKVHGLHEISAEISRIGLPKNIVDRNENKFYTIPKGIFVTADTSIVQNQYQIIYDLPYIGKIFFDSSMAVVKDNYLRDWLIEPPLRLFAKRLIENPTIKIYLQGTIDPNSGETDLKLANDRAAAVRDSLHRLGVDLTQIEILEGINLESRRLPKNPEDQRWVLEERRRVDITTDEPSEEILFKPLQATFAEKNTIPFILNSNIVGTVPLTDGVIYLTAAAQTDSLKIGKDLNGKNLIRDFSWLISDDSVDRWLEKEVMYSLVLSDSMKREFKVRPQKTHFVAQTIGRERRYYVLAKFESASAYYAFYWTNLISTVPFLLEDVSTRMCFHGHGCATGPESINIPLSKKRATYFQTKFLDDVKERYPDLFENIKQRNDAPQGSGESQPLEFRTLEGKTIILGDNETPLGRQLNRRVMVFFYTNRDAKLKCLKDQTAK